MNNFTFTYMIKNVVCLYNQISLNINIDALSLSLPVDEVKKWWIWGYWISPMMYSQNAIVINEFLGESWNHVFS